MKSRVRGDFHARFCERLRVKLPRSTRPCPLWFVDDPLWFADAAFCISKYPTSVKNRLHFLTFPSKALHNPNKSLTFATREPAKPLNDAQMCGSFFVYTLLNMANLIPFTKRFESSENLVNLLESRGLQICDRTKAIQYENINIFSDIHN